MDILDISNLRDVAILQNYYSVKVLDEFGPLSVPCQAVLSIGMSSNKSRTAIVSKTE